MTSDTTTKSLDPRVARSRARVLDAAAELLAEGGPAALTVDAVSARSGVAKSTMYRHWDSRDDLLVDVLRHNLPHLELVPGDGFEATLRATVAAAAERASDPEWQKILPALFQLKQHVAAIETIADDEQQEQIETFARVFEMGIAEGRLPADLDMEFASLHLMGPIVLAAIGIGGRAPIDHAERVVDRFLAAWS